MTTPGGLLLTPGAGSNRDNPSLIAIEDAGFLGPSLRQRHAH